MRDNESDFIVAIPCLISSLQIEVNIPLSMTRGWAVDFIMINLSFYLCFYVCYLFYRRPNKYFVTKTDFFKYFLTKQKNRIQQY